ncbi:hypothetical protein ACFE04_020583 [Oxalis oulophora]
MKQVFEFVSRRITPHQHHIHRRRSLFPSSDVVLPLSSNSNNNRMVLLLSSRFSTRGRTAILVVLCCCFCCYFLYQHLTTFSSSTSTSIFDSFHKDKDIEDHQSNLQTVLNNAAIKTTSTVILTTLNQPWATPNSVLDLFLHSFSLGHGTRKLLKHLVIIALDQNSYKRCLLLHPHCYPLITHHLDFHQEAYFMSPTYLNMMWTRIHLLHSVLQMGFSFVFTDADIMWFRDPFPRFYENTDFQIACDQFLGDPDDILNIPNGGFNYVKSNNRTIQFYNYWYSSRERYLGYHDQDVLNRIKFDPFIEDIGLTIKFLDTAYFGGLCEPSKDLNLVCTMHANCCYGLENKLIDLGVMLEDWKTFKAWPLSFKKSLNYSWNVPQNCSLLARHHYNSEGEIIEQAPLG